MINHEAAWNAVFGPYETRETVLRMAEDQHLTVQDFAMGAIVEAEAQGYDGDHAETYASLCKQLDVDCC